MAHRIVMLLGVSMVCLCSGCATSTTGKYQSITVTSEPKGAKIRTTNGLSLVTPGSFYFRRDRDYILVAEYPDCKSQLKELKYKMQGWSRESTLLGRMIDGGVDVPPESQGCTLFSRIIRGDVNRPPKPRGTLTPNRVHFDFRQFSELLVSSPGEPGTSPSPDE